MVRSISLSEQDSVRKKSAGPQLGSQGYPTKVTLRRMAQFISVRYESAPKQGSRIQRWCLFHSQNNTVSKKSWQDPCYGPKGTLRRSRLVKINLDKIDIGSMPWNQWPKWFQTKLFTYYFRGPYWSEHKTMQEIEERRRNCFAALVQC